MVATKISLFKAVMVFCKVNFWGDDIFGMK